MDLNEYGKAMNALMEQHRANVQNAVTKFITEVRDLNTNTQTEITRLSGALIGNENGETDKKSPAQISNSIFGNR